MAEVASYLHSLKAASFPIDADRKAVLSEARALLTRLETPWETGFRYTWIHPTRMACLRIAMQLGLFEKWKESGGEPKSVDELGEMVKCDHLLLSRVVCHLGATQMLDLVEPGIFGLTPFTAALAAPAISSTVDLYFDVNGPANINLPTYVESIDYQNPSDHVNGNLTHCFGRPLWEWLKDRPKSEATIGTVMATYAANRPHLSEIYPTTTLITAAQDNTVLLVDCGGGIGHDIRAFAEVHPQMAGKLVLQDRQSVIDNVRGLDPAIEKMAYDFFTPQPIKGAAIYYFHFVLHDWPDSDCKKILENLRPSMKKGYSKLLIHEVVLDPLAPEPLRTTSDISMMAVVSGHERTEQQWTSLLEGCGFKINNIHHKPLAIESVIEAVPW